ncbi:TadE/TadG family type IV pilus assembly protein [Streptomyces sp. TRM 70351]|uniref:TadE/TadG family type IV pilus assembly protein n=1 Tax=Streptomyces sp. TRM 70351 TaxID=3116552 RepID=UPI002E7AE668|nr:TadE/TadG family type IV pilus assembly protein [Streptomyces sp. TRM 70351]MEE1927807.1 TadE/TadG family type IV pilus assembly protein [Streptomyces sp. TRM 70351]
MTPRPRTPRPPRTAPAARPAPAAAHAPSATGRDRGQAAIEFIGFLPLLLLVALAAVQLGIAAYTAQQAGTAARTAARYVSQDDTRAADPAGRAALSDWLAERAGFTEARPPGEVTVTATVPIPSVIPGVDFGSVEKSATMPRVRDVTRLP